jgi:hypothetical protein
MEKRRGIIIGCIVILLLVGCTNIALADTEIEASTKTNITTSGGDIVVLRLIIPKYEVKTPDLCFIANGEATTVINHSGSAQIEENYVATAVKKGPNVVAGGMVTSTYSATNVKEIKTNISSEVEVKKGKNVLHTYVSGISLAYPGPCSQADYELGLYGSHQVKTDAIFRGIISDAEFQKIRMSFEAYPRQMDPPADVVTETINVNYNMEEGVISSIGFDFLNKIEANDITCTSSMIYMRGGE